MPSVKRISTPSVAPADIAGDNAHQQPEQAAEHRGEHADQQRDLPAQHETDQLVAAGLVGAEWVVGRGRPILREQIRLIRVGAQPVRSRPGGEREHQQ